MRSINECCQNGINNLNDLKEALHLAMKLEFSTIPLYLCAQWSIKEDPDRVEGVFHHIVGQEMNHFALVGNVLSAIGGKPDFANKKFLPQYPLHELPGKIPLSRPAHLAPLSFDQVKVFLEIEQPNFSSDEDKLNEYSIGEFYETIIDSLISLRPKIKQNYNQIFVELSPRIKSFKDAVTIIERIMLEGEGCPKSPLNPTSDGHNFAHYYLFKEIYFQRKLVKEDSGWFFTGSRIYFPKVHNSQALVVDKTDLVKFHRILTKLLKELENCWLNGHELNVSTMFHLKIEGKNLIKKGITPTFEWLE